MRDKRTPKDVCGEARSLRDAAFVSTHIVYMYQPHGCWFIELNAGVMQFSSLFFLSFFLSLFLPFFLSFSLSFSLFLFLFLFLFFVFFMEIPVNILTSKMMLSNFNFDLLLLFGTQVYKHLRG